MADEPDEQEQQEPVVDIDGEMVMYHEVYLRMKRAGFRPYEALILLGQIIRRPDPEYPETD